jgi:Asp-tRNA(Asn)/Glu-tRNA(Gln) amidotransferase B subunit
MIEKSKAKITANIMLNDISAMLKRRGWSIEQCPIQILDLSFMISLMMDGHIDRRTLKEWMRHEFEVRDREILLLEKIKEVLTLLIENAKKESSP